MIVTATAHAKINLYLRVLERLPNGYHRLESVMQSLLLHDEVGLATRPQGIFLSYTWVDPVQQGASFAVDLGDQGQASVIPSDERNLAWRAAELLQRNYRIQQGVHIQLRKAIPQAAGLAGGSADAAAVLLGLNKLWHLNLGLPELMTLGAKLGADVPFCLAGGTKLCTGIGDVVSDAPSAPVWPVLLVKPGFSLSTAEVYRHWDEGSYGRNDGQAVGGWEGLCQSLEYQDVASVGKRLYNELEFVSRDIAPQLVAWKALISQTHPKGVAMTGSGPTLFALYGTESEAVAAAQTLVASPNAPGPAQVMVTKTWTHGCGLATCGGSYQ